MSGLVTRLRFEVEDRVRFDPLARALVSRRWTRQALALPERTDPERIARVAKLCHAATVCPPGERERVEAAIRETVARVEGTAIDWTRIWTEVASPKMHSAAILKPYVGPREKGVLMISFEKQWTKLLVHPDPRALAARYTVIIGPSWTPPHSCGVTVFPRLFPDPVYSTISHDDDLATLRRLSDRILPVPLLASNWVDPDDFAPRPPAERDVDLVMVATFGKYKRHHALLKALARMDRRVRVLLVGTDNPDLGAAGVRALARAYGVEDRLVGVGAEDYAGVARAFCRAKASVIMSRREGSCQAVVESMFADTPVGVLEGAEMGSTKYVNDRTGRALREDRLAEDLARLLADAAGGAFSPRRWALENGISCHASTRLLNEQLKRDALAAGGEWTRDLAVHAWNPYPELVRPEDRAALAPEYRDVAERFGLKIGPEAAARWEAPPGAAGRTA